MNNAAHPFSIKDSLICGWEAFLAHYTVFVPVVFLSLAISFISNYIGKDGLSTITVATVVLGSIAQVIIGMGLTKIALKITRGEPVAFDDAFSTAHLFFSYLGANLLYGLIVAAGFLLLIIPGVLWMVTYWLFQYILIDKESGALVSLSEAKHISKGVRWPLFKFMMVVIALNIAGAITFMIGLFFTVPVTVVATAYVYRILQKRLEPEQIEEQVIKEVAENASQLLPPKPSPIHPEQT